ncbi:MAG: hypothetical protein WBW88_17345, partial [Rhodothermales bacterium]
YNWDDGTFGGSIYIQSVGSAERRFLVKGYDPDWSPDGQWLTFSSIGYNIEKVSLDGKKVVQLTSQSKDLVPAWSPDGKTIAYYVATSDENTSGIAVLDVNGVSSGRLFLGGTPDWFPDGRLFAYLGRASSFLIYDRKSAHLDTIPAPLPGPQVVHSPQVSPDGKRIVFYSESGGIWLCNIDGSDMRLIVRDDLSKYASGNPEVRVGVPSWHPDGRHIIFEYLKITKFMTNDIGHAIDGEYSIRTMDVGPVAKKG